jgi:hypothetical protein
MYRKVYKSQRLTGSTSNYIRHYKKKHPLVSINEDNINKCKYNIY